MSLYQKLLNRFSSNKYRLTIFVLLAGDTIISLGTLRLRYTFSNDGKYYFLIWNLFLAWIPFIIAYFTYALTLKRTWLYMLIPLSAFLWLIFFPNAPYILTDFQHLRGAGQDIPVWYDVLVFIWFAWTGLLLGIVSLFMMQEIVRREFGRWVGWGFVVFVAGLTSVGIYVGRFLRWNSWDIFSNPKQMALLAIERAQSPSMQSIIFTLLFAAFFLFLYITLYAFGHLLLERQVNETKQT
ncbi:MAG: DUF1361 domain-containing protein [Chloroflexota bacterium]